MNELVFILYSVNSYHILLPPQGAVIRIYSLSSEIKFLEKKKRKNSRVIHSFALGDIFFYIGCPIHIIVG